MAEKSGDLSVVSYTLGITSIIMAFFQPLAGLVLGIIGLLQSKKQKTPLSQKARKYNIIGIIIGIIVFVLSIVAALYFAKSGTGLVNFPIA